MLNENDFVSLKEYADWLAESYAILSKLSQSIQGGEERMQEEVRLLVESGVPLPEAMYRIIKNIIEGKIE